MYNFIYNYDCSHYLTEVIKEMVSFIMIRDARKQELKEQIYRKALELFREKGFNQVTVEQITQACGIAKGTFYIYFPKKEAVLLHLGRMQIESVHQSILRHAEVHDMKEKLLLLFHDLFVRYSEHSEIIRLTISEMMRSTLLMEEELQIIQNFQSSLTNLFEQAKQTGQLSTHFASEDVASVLVGIYFNALMVWVSTPQMDTAIMTIFTRHFELVWHGINSREVDRR
jgi:AcrR family transcriptional regulator